MGFQAAVGNNLLDGEALRHELTALVQRERDAEKRRKTVLAHLKSVFHPARAHILDQAAGGALRGWAAARALSSVHDMLIQVLYDLATKHFYYAQNPTESEHLAIIATGGYGRGLLAPFSDIDLLFLRPFKQTAWGESVIEFVLLMMWDLGLKVGHATRSLAECMRLAREDMTIRTAVLELRHIQGDAALAEDLRRRFRSEVVAGSEDAFVEAKLREREARHRKQGESRYLVEPNLKEGKGGLRDLQTLYWIGKYLYGVDNPADLVKFGVYTQDEYKTFHAADAFLWDVRVQLHCLAGRAEERLTFDMQPGLAGRMGYTDADPRRAIERFMRAYFLVAKDVGDLTRIFCAALEEQNRKPRLAVARMLPGFLRPRVAEDDFYIENGRLNARRDAFARDPANLIRVFHVADEKRVDIHPHALRTITRALDLVTDGLREDRTANRLFVEVLSSRNDPERALRRMNEAGVLGRFVPAFDHAIALMQFNMYHHYTVDEHLIRAVGVLASIERGHLRTAHPLASGIVRRIRSRTALYCAVFLHDIAKGLPGSHSEIGAAAAQTLCPRWGLADDDTAIVLWLVRNHLVMSDIAQRRDISDPTTVRDFVAQVQAPELLRLLLVLTEVDIDAVGPGVWNGWKAQLLTELYHEAEAAMSGTAAAARAARVEQAKALLSARLADLPQSERQHTLARHHETYWLAFDALQLERNARLQALAREEREPFALDTTLDAARGICEIAVCTRDHPGLFCQLAGAIASCGGSILEAKAFTADDGWALDAFSVHDVESGLFGDPARLTKLRRNIAAALAGQPIAVGRVTRQPGARRATAFGVRVKVNIDNEASGAATVLEVEGADRPALLFDIARAIFDLGLSISSAIVATYGERVADVFYVRDVFGHKVTGKERLGAVEARLLQALAGGS